MVVHTCHPSYVESREEEWQSKTGPRQKVIPYLKNKLKQKWPTAWLKVVECLQGPKFKPQYCQINKNQVSVCIRFTNSLK
jgi:hypothetical protein